MPATPETLPDPERLIVAVDTGGTFTDAVGRRGDRVAVAKVPSTPADPAAAVLDAVRRVAAAVGGDADELVHGTTVATNALLEERGAETWLVVDAGFEELLAIGRQTRPELYALHVAPRESLVPRPLTVGVRGRIDASGAAVEPVDLGALHAAIDAMDARPRSWAVCLLHAGVDAAREREIRDVILARCPDDRVTLSSEVSAEPREVERATTAVASAMVQPVLATYLARLEPAAASVCVMSSAGGRLSLVEAAARPVTTATSGPAGGALAAQEIARAVVAREPRLRGVVTFDMGGTSTDVALCVGAVPMRRESRVGRFSLSVSALDIHTVGAGGGSVARVDAGGGLRVGPMSAGADPGPAAYGRGGPATVTDANIVLARLPADARLAGEVPLDVGAAHAAVGQVAAALGVTAEAAASGIVAVAVEAMAGAIRRVSVERGVDPRELALCAFGGAGGLHACALAATLGIDVVVVPARAGLLCAVGMLASAAAVEREAAALGRDDAAVAALLDATAASAAASLTDVARIVRTADLRYLGQAYSLEVTADDGVERARELFAQAHAARFGHQLDAPIEVVSVRARAEGPPPTSLPSLANATVETLVGPVSKTSLSSTLWVPAGWVAELDELGGAWLSRIREPDSEGAR